MNDGKSLKVQGNWLEKYFHLDKYGSLIPSKDSLRTEAAAAKVSSLIAQDRDLERDMMRKIFSTDVEFAMRPEGSTPVIAGGIKLFGPSPLRKLSFKGKLAALDSSSRKNSDFLKRCKNRANRINNWVRDAINTVEELHPENEAQEALKEVERDQVLTGGGYDNTEAFSITKSLLDFLVQSSVDIDYENGDLSRVLMEEIMQFKSQLYSELGVKEGSLRITSFTMVRLMQESDGMIGFPVFKKSGAKLTKEVARRISIWSGVDCRWMAGGIRQEDYPENHHHLNSEDENPSEYTVLDAMCYCLDHMMANPDESTFDALIWTLARIQRHGYKMEDGDLHAKDGKARSVSPNAAFSAAQEAMTGDPFIKLLKERKVSWMPSLQDRATADQLIRDWYEKVLVPKEMRALPADWSGYDKTVKGCCLATILYYIVKPLFHFDDQKWVDLAIVSLVYKYFFISVDAAKANPELWEQVQQAYTLYPVSDNFVLVGTYNGLGSGAKLTHVGGSLYGELIIHHCIPKLLGYDGVSGPQAGDDTSLAMPESMIDINSAEKTYQPVADAAAKYGLTMNVGKQMWVVGGGEVMNIFLQYSYNYNLDIWGVGTAARYYVAYPFAEREKFLSIGEQYMAIISKFNNSVSNPWVDVWITKWLSQDDYICALFKEYGVKAFNDIIVKSIGSSIQEVSERLELTYNWGLTQEQLAQGDIPVLPIIASVASGMSPKATVAEAMSALKLQEGQILNAREVGGYEDDIDIDNDEPASDSEQSEDAAAE